MLNWHDKFAEYGIKEAFIRDLFEYYRIKKLFHSSQENSVTLFVKVKKVFIALQYTSFPFQGSGSPANLNKKVMSESKVTTTILKLSGSFDLKGMQDLGIYQIFLQDLEDDIIILGMQDLGESNNSCAKVVLISI